MGIAAKYFNEVYKKKLCFWLLKITLETSKVYFSFIISLRYVPYITSFFRVFVDELYSLNFFPDAAILTS